ncbi:MAG: hypothetical protein ACR2HM_04645 [Acidimicrobiales bacterium]
MVSDPQYVEFQPDRADDVVAAMEAAAERGTGWVNFEPAVDVDDVASAGSSAFALFSGRGPVIPLGTWTPAKTTGRGRREPAMLGLQHPAGSKAVPLLADLGHPVPEGWVVMQDYVKKGLVLALPDTAGAGEALTWLLRAARLVSTVRLDGGWRAAVYLG